MRPLRLAVAGALLGLILGSLGCAASIDVKTVDCVQRPGGSMAFRCDHHASPSGWCAGTAEMRGKTCLITVCRDKAALPHEKCECECWGKGHDSECFQKCKAAAGFDECAYGTRA